MDLLRVHIKRSAGCWTLALVHCACVPRPPLKPFQAVPSLKAEPLNRSWSGKRISQPRFLERGFHAPKVTLSTCDDDVVDCAGSAATIRQDVIELEPHALESGVLGCVRSSPGQGTRVGISD